MEEYGPKRVRGGWNWFFVTFLRRLGENRLGRGLMRG